MVQKYISCDGFLALKTMENKSLTVNASSMDESSNSYLHEEKRWFKIFLCVIYSFIFIFGILGNAIVCFVMYQRRNLKTVTNLFILNLAISDLIFAGSIPLEFPLIIDDYQWPYTSFFCKLYTPVQTIAVSASTFSLTAVSIVRYRAIINPLKKQISHGYAKYMLFGIWTFSTMLMIPHIVTLKMKESTCEEEWPLLTYRKIYTTFLFVFLYVVPLTIVSISYTTIVCELKKKRDFHNTVLNNIRNEETKKIVGLLIKVTFTFAIFNLPSQLMWLWLDFGNADKMFPFFWDLLASFNVFVFANSACNPLLYYMFHDSFKQEVNLYFTKCCKKKTIQRTDCNDKLLCFAEQITLVPLHTLSVGPNKVRTCCTPV